jgi:hypothetical protein
MGKDDLSMPHSPLMIADHLEPDRSMAPHAIGRRDGGRNTAQASRHFGVVVRSRLLLCDLVRQRPSAPTIVAMLLSLMERQRRS